MTKPGLDGLTTLSRSSDHLGNLANVLKDLGGGATLLNELTQNANDAKADRIRFTSSDDELTIWNSALFSDCGSQDLRHCPWKVDGGERTCDLHSFRQVAGRHKAGDDATTGAFGVGFTAVYQVTDHPELVTGQTHFVLDESLAEDQRIQICAGGCGRDHSEKGTMFYLPWARERTDLRRELGASTLDDAGIVELTEQMHDAADSALIFLEHVKYLDVESAAKSTSVVRERERDSVVISVDGNQSEWVLLEGTAVGADDLKKRYDRVGSRSALVQIAVPLSAAIIGRIYADLPTETPSGWRGHINATFFPRQDRKTIEFDGLGFQGKWNDLLIDTAARVMTEHLVSITSRLSHRVAWTYLVDAEQINRGISKAEYPKAFGAFFRRAKATVPQLPITLLADGRSVVAAGSIVPRNESEYEASDVLMRLGLAIIDPSIRPQVRQVSYTEYGIHQLGAADVVGALRQAGVIDPWSPSDQGTISSSEVESLLRLLNHLADRGKTTLLHAGADSVAIVPCVDGSFASAKSVSKLDADDQALFELLAPDIKILDQTRLAALCPALAELCSDITPALAIAIFDRDHEALGAGPLEVLKWLDNHRAALNDNSVRASVRALPVFPSTNTGFKPLTQLSLASTFEDVLGVADVVDMHRASGHEDLLRLLGAKELNAVEYLTRHVVPRAKDGSLQGQLLRQILEIIYGERRNLEADDTALLLLKRAPLVRCTDGATRSALTVHSPNRALALISPDEPVADLAGLAPHLVETLYWLGVSRAPTDRVLAAAAARLASDDADPPNDVVLAILDALPDPLPDSVPPPLSSLETEAWLPVEGGGRDVPSKIYAVFQREIFESQGRKLALSRSAQGERAKTLAWIGVQSTPTTAMVVAHLRNCVKTRKPVNDQVYRALGEAKNSLLVRGLRGEPCVQVRPGDFVDPAFVFWTDQGLGRWAHLLPHGQHQFRQFFDLVGVADAPGPSEVEKILRRISRELANDPLDADDRAVVHRCWELLDQKLADETSRAQAQEVLRRLGAIRSAPDGRGMLGKPNSLLFIDGRRLAEKFTLIRNELIRRDRATQRALAAAGVRAAEDLVETLIDPEIVTSPADQLRALVMERLPAIKRLVESHRNEQLTFDVERLEFVRFLIMPDLVLQYQVRFAYHVQTIDPERADAVFLDDKHHLLVRSQVPTRQLARELARAIESAADVSVIASSLYEILSARTLDDAMHILNEYGVPDLDDTTWDHVATDGSEGGGDIPASTAATQGLGADETSTSASTPSSKQDSGAGGHLDVENNGSATSSSEGETHNRSTSKAAARTATGQRRTQMASFVSFDDDETGVPDESSDESQENAAVDAAGVRRVLRYEESCGRTPKEQAHNNPGFDILSCNADGKTLRRIEVKSMGSAWTGFGVWMSATQMEENQAHGDDFWLYVVEHAQDDDAAVLHRIHNPAGEATKFGFDAGWQALREPDMERDHLGALLVDSTRRLLGWGSASTADSL